MTKALWEEGGAFDQVQEITQALGWDNLEDNIVVEIGGASVSGIDVGEEYNKKWQSPKGTVKYNKEAFIIIKNLSRSPFVPSQPNPDLVAHHLNTDNNEETDSAVIDGSDTDSNSSAGGV